MTGMTLRGRLCIIAVFLFTVALALRIGVALLTRGTSDVTNFVATARMVQAGQNVYQGGASYPYPELYSKILADVLDITDPLRIDSRFAVRLPAIVADSLITVLVFVCALQLYSERTARWIGVMYALNPITIMVCSHHGQFDSLAYLPAVFAIWLELCSVSWISSAVAIGVGAALKITPIFLVPAWFASLKSRRQILGFSAIAVLILCMSMFASWVSAPNEFYSSVVAYGRMARDAAGYNFVLRGLERIPFSGRAVWVTLDAMLRANYQLVILAGIVLTTVLLQVGAGTAPLRGRGDGGRGDRAPMFITRAFMIQASVQIFSGRWGHEYAVWLVPLMLLVNQRGVLPYSVLTIAWMVVSYIAFESGGTLQDNLFRVSTVIMFASWAVLLCWYASNLRSRKGMVLGWFSSPLM